MRRFLHSWLLPALLGLGIGASPCLAGAELVLVDGQILSGVDVQLKDEVYELTLETGDVLSIPADLVEELRLSGGSDEDRPATGLVRAEPRVLAGGEARMPRTSEQVEVFRQPSRFPRSPIDPTWRPTSDWDNSTDLNNFNPARWYVAPIDPTWTPRSDFTNASDVTRFNPAQFARSIIDPVWRPVDGFAKKKASWEMFRSEPEAP